MRLGPGLGLGLAFGLAACVPAAVNRQVTHLQRLTEISKISQTGDYAACVEKAGRAIAEDEAAAAGAEGTARLEAKVRLLEGHMARRACLAQQGKREQEEADREQCRRLSREVAEEGRAVFTSRSPDSGAALVPMKVALIQRAACLGTPPDDPKYAEDRLSLTDLQLEVIQDHRMLPYVYTERAELHRLLKREQDAKQDEARALAALDREVADALAQVQAGQEAGGGALGRATATNEPRLAAAYAARAEFKTKVGLFSEAVPDLEAELQIRAELCREHGGLVKRFCEDAANRTEALAVLKKKASKGPAK